MSEGRKRKSHFHGSDSESDEEEDVQVSRTACEFQGDAFPENCQTARNTHLPHYLFAQARALKAEQEKKRRMAEGTQGTDRNKSSGTAVPPGPPPGLPPGLPPGSIDHQTARFTDPCSMGSVCKAHPNICLVLCHWKEYKFRARNCAVICRGKHIDL